MARFLPHTDKFPIEDQIRTLGDDELLDFWEETQNLDKLLGEDYPEAHPQTMEYERIILQELQLRSCKRCAQM